MQSTLNTTESSETLLRRPTLEKFINVNILYRIFLEVITDLLSGFDMCIPSSLNT
jgi:hypothetical protein